MADPFFIAIIILTFLLAGTVKGVVGLGLPTISLAVLTIVTDLPDAMSLLIIPSFATNVFQAVIGDATLSAFRRIWPFLLAATSLVWLGALALTRVDTHLLSALLGVLIVTYAGLSLLGVRLQLRGQPAGWVGPLAGAINGIFTGMTGSFVFPGIMYLQSLGLPRDHLIQAMGMLFTISTLALGLALYRSDILTAELGLMSLMGLLPALFGMAVGRRVRQTMPEQVFRRAIFTALLVLGVYLFVSSILELAN